ncbi:MAG: LysR family transcriptional regulator [Acidimicrobiia bacterium]|nr:LysR family transcriptional regulator [Acidimicrobiia bacterium]
MAGSDLSPRQLRAILAVAELGNISHAAIELGVSQPSLSRTIAKIEGHLGTELFVRDSSGVVPTEAGERLARRGSEVLRQLDDIEDEIRSLDGNLHGRVCVAMPDTTGHTLFLPVLDRIKAEYPEVEVRVMGAHPNNIPLALSAGDADVGVVSSAHRHEGLELRPLVVESLHLVGPPERRRHRGPVDLEAVAELPLALPGIQPGLRQLIDRAFSSIGLSPNVVVEIDAQDALVELIRAGRAYSIMSYAGVSRPVSHNAVHAYEIENPRIDRTLSTAFRRGHTPTRLMRAVEDTLHHLATELASEARWHPAQ